MAENLIGEILGKVSGFVDFDCKMEHEGTIFDFTQKYDREKTVKKVLLLDGNELSHVLFFIFQLLSWQIKWQCWKIYSTTDSLANVDETGVYLEKFI